MSQGRSGRGGRGKPSKLPTPGVGTSPVKMAEGTGHETDPLTKKIQKLDELDLTISGVKTTLDGSIEASEFNSKNLEDKIDGHIKSCEKGTEKLLELEKDAGNTQDTHDVSSAQNDGHRKKNRGD